MDDSGVAAKGTVDAPGDNGVATNDSSDCRIWDTSTAVARGIANPPSSSPVSASVAAFEEAPAQVSVPVTPVATPKKKAAVIPGRRVTLALDDSDEEDSLESC